LGQYLIIGYTLAKGERPRSAKKNFCFCAIKDLIISVNTLLEGLCQKQFCNIKQIVPPFLWLAQYLIIGDPSAKDERLKLAKKSFHFCANLGFHHTF
jgi:hypothetical protein